MSSKVAQKPRLRRVPRRTCVACQQTTAKRELVRIVRTLTGSVRVDPTGKQSGRGAYLCRATECWQVALRKDRLSRALRARLTVEDREALTQYADLLLTANEGIASSGRSDG